MLYDTQIPKGDTVKKLFVIAAAGMVLASCSSEMSDSSKEAAAEVKCQTAVKNQVTGTDYDDFSDMRVITFGDGWKVSGAVQGTNTLGGPAQQRFVCDASWDANAKDVDITKVKLS